ncbi:hypothetical protein Tsubulata_001786, partial [Turnera subulata]
FLILSKLGAAHLQFKSLYSSPVCGEDGCTSLKINPMVHIKEKRIWVMHTYFAFQLTSRKPTFFLNEHHFLSGTYPYLIKISRDPKLVETQI